MGRIFLVRHGEVEWNRQNAYVGATDLSLNEKGREQAVLLADRIAKMDISAVYSSTLNRARETAETVAGRLGLPVQKVGQLREISYGDWEGLSVPEIKSRYPQIYQDWLAYPASARIPGGETFGELRDRVFPQFREIAEKHHGEDIVIVAHKSANRVLLCCVLGVDVDRYKQIGQDNACLNLIEHREAGRFGVRAINDRCHLR